MISPERLYDFLQQQGVSFYTGVPDSLLKPFLAWVQDHTPEGGHIITANEGLALALASGYHFATGGLPLVYLQNSGLGNLINPLTSLADKEMYGVPVLLVIGWRGRPGTRDEPQHLKMGRITIPLLEALEVPCFLPEAGEESFFETTQQAIDLAKKSRQPVALVIPGDFFSPYTSMMGNNTCSLQRETVIQHIIHHLRGDEIVVATTGKTGREFYEQNEAAGKKISRYLLSVGAMGHAHHVALGLQQRRGEKVVMLDGDGAVLMQMGGLPSIAHYAQAPFVHIVINNGSHESVGGQPTEAFRASLCDVAKASGYPVVVRISEEAALQQWLREGLVQPVVQFVEIRTTASSRSDLGRPAGTPGEWKNDLMNALKSKG